MNVLLLYSWEDNHTKSKQWVTSMCYELSNYENINASCDLFWNPKSNVKKLLETHIKNADKIIVIVTESYNKKISNSTGIVSYEEKIYRDIILKEEPTSKILFLLKEKNIGMPNNWENYVRIDVSKINEFEYPYLSEIDKKSVFDRIARFCLDLPEYKIPSKSSNDSTKSLIKDSISFDTLFYRYISEKKTPINTPAHQEKILLQYIKTNIDDKSFVYDYIRSGLAADLNFSDKITPELFNKYFLVKRSDNEEKRYNACLRDLFNSDSHNVLCLQSDGGSGKSVFIQSLAYRGEKQGRKYKYSYFLFDLSHLHENQMSKEEQVYQKLRKEYKRMSRDNEDNKTYNYIWRSNFSNMLLALDDVEYNATNLFKLNNFRKQLKDAIKKIIPEENNLDGWYDGYSQRLSEMKSSTKDKNILFIILLSVFLLILLSKPYTEKPPRYILVFDNIETYDNGEEAKTIAQYITGCHSFLTKIFLEIGERNSFFTRFTFVFVLRTSTFIRFGSLQDNFLRGGTFNKQIKYFDFTAEALLKKLKFLQKINNYNNSVVFKEMYLLISIFVPSQIINDYLNEKIETTEINYYTSHRLIPLFNNDYRRTVEYLYRAVMDDELYDEIHERLKKIGSLTGNSYDCGINGIRMSIIRYIFNDLRANQYFDKIGFPGLSGKEEHSMTRILLSFLYWDELKSIALHSEKRYKGVSLATIFNTFKYFCEHKQIIKLLYDLSIFTNNEPNRKEALDAWGNLITFKNLKHDIKDSEFYESTQNYLNNNIQLNDINLNNIHVMLSDAGMCFCQYYIRNMEFIMSRSKNGTDIQSLFVTENINEIKNILSEYYNIIINCIEKMIGRCEPICTLYGHKKSDCVLLSKSKEEYKLFSCSLFIRYQECLDLIREALNYIDRFRIVIYNNSKNEEIINELVIQLRHFYGLYDYTYKKMLENVTEECIEMKQFMNNWTYSNNRMYNNIIVSNRNHRIENERPVQSYYAVPKEDFELALKELSTNPKIRLHQLIIEISNKKNCIPEETKNR